MENFLFFAYITSTFGLEVNKIFKDYANCNRKLAKRIPQRIFLIRCRRAKLIPGFLVNYSRQFYHMLPNNPVQSKKLERVTNNFQRKVLNVLIADKDHEIKSLEAEMKRLQTEVKSFEKYWFVSRFLQSQKVSKLHTIELYKNTNTKKFNDLKQRTFHKLQFSTKLNNNWFINTTDIDIPEDIWATITWPKVFASY